MAKTTQEIEQEFLDAIEEKTGKSLKSWMAIFKEKRFSKPNEVMNWLKSEQGFRHLEASMLGRIYINGGKPVYGSEDALLEDQFVKREHLRPLYDHLIAVIQKHFSDVSILPKKTYVSVHYKREFAAITIKSKEIRLGMDLGDMPFDDKILPAKSLGAMPRISHMVLLTEKDQISAEVVALLKQANERVNG